MRTSAVAADDYSGMQTVCRPEEGGTAELVLDIVTNEMPRGDSERHDNRTPL